MGLQEDSANASFRTAARERSNKIDKVEPFDLCRVVGDFQSGALRSVRASADLGPAHSPHVDLFVARPGEQQIKYRILDDATTREFQAGFGKDGLTLP